MNNIAVYLINSYYSINIFCGVFYISNRNIYIYIYI